MSYTIKDREFTFKPVTMRVRAEVHELSIKDGEIDYEGLERDGELLNKFMRLVLEGDHNGIDWFELLDEEVQPIIADFFMRSGQRTLKWKSSLLKSYESLDNTTKKESESQDQAQ